MNYHSISSHTAYIGQQFEMRVKQKLCIFICNWKQLSQEFENMLGFKGYLEQSRARRGFTQFPVHYEVPDIKSNQNIKQFVNLPNYGQIFYSPNAQNGRPHEFNNHLKSSLQTEKNRREELVKYVYQLEQENTMLKNHLAEVLQAQQTSSNPNTNSNLRIKPHQQYYDGRLEPEYITSSIPTQNYIKEQPIYQHAPHYSFTGNVPRTVGVRNQGHNSPGHQRSSIPVNSNPNLDNSLYQPQQRYTHSPVIPEQVSTQYLTEQQINSQPQIAFDSQAQYPAYRNPENYAFGVPTQSFPYRQSHQNIQRSQNQRNMFEIAKQKLNQIKDDDEELRAYTLKLLKKN